MPTFNDFRSGPGAAIAKRIFDLDIAGLASWKDFHAAVADHRGHLGGKLIDRIKAETPKLSSSERAIALALLHAVDYAEQADEIGGNFLRLFRQCSGSHRTAVVAVLAQED